jgi:hypothetical protein
MNTLSIVLTVIGCTMVLVTSVIGATWRLAGKIADLQTAIATANGKIEGLQLIISSLQSRIIHLESRLDAKG